MPPPPPGALPPPAAVPPAAAAAAHAAAATAAAAADCASRGMPDGPEPSSVTNTMLIVGTLLVIGASFVSCFGLNMQKLSHNHTASLPVAQRRSVYRCWRWWTGLVLLVLGSAMDVAALPFIPLSRVAALGSSSLVANIIITPAFLKERISRHDLVGCGVAVIGTSIACYFGAVREPQLDTECMLRYLTEAAFVAYMCLVGAFCGMLAYLAIGFRRRQKLAEHAGIIGGTDQPMALECVWAHNNSGLLRDLPHDASFPYVTRCGPQFYPTVHAAFAGTVGAQSVMFAKALAISLGQVIAGRDTVRSAKLAAGLLLPTCGCLWGQIAFLNEALRIYCDAVFVLPVYQAFWVTWGIASGLIFYEEYRRVPQRHIAMFVVGVSTCLGGLFILSRRKSYGGSYGSAAKIASPATRPLRGGASSPVPGAGGKEVGAEPEEAVPARPASGVARSRSTGAGLSGSAR